MNGTIVYPFRRRDVRKLTCLTAKFQEHPIEPHRKSDSPFLRLHRIVR